MSTFLHPFLGYFHFPARCLLAFLDEAVVGRLIKKISEARRAINRRTEAYIGSTLTRGD
jgi:hypothetical protein